MSLIKKYLKEKLWLLFEVYLPEIFQSLKKMGLITAWIFIGLYSGWFCINVLKINIETTALTISTFYPVLTVITWMIWRDYEDFKNSVQIIEEIEKEDETENE